MIKVIILDRYDPDHQPPVEILDEDGEVVEFKSAGEAFNYLDAEASATLKLIREMEAERMRIKANLRRATDHLNSVREGARKLFDVL